MSASDSLGPQFDDSKRLADYRAAKTVSGTTVFYGVHQHRYKPNPFASHITPPDIEHHDDGSVTYRPTHGIPGYSPTAHVVSEGVKDIPLNRLESTQHQVSHNHVRNMNRRKGTAPPIEVVHHIPADRYVIEEGNHRATVALLRGQKNIRAEVTRMVQR